MNVGPYALGDVHHVTDSLAALRELPDGCVDALITDPPYSSGGFTRGDRTGQTTTTKYTQTGSGRVFEDFAGDNRDQRGWLAWCSIWLGECRRLVREGGYALMFTDWRMLPAATDALQAGGFVWRGIVAWDKGGGARVPHTGYFRHQCEYIVWGTNGPCLPAKYSRPLSGCPRFNVKQNDKHHLTGKPTELMRSLVQVVAPGATVLDPFAGSGTTCVAAEAEGRRFLAFEQSAYYVEVARERLEAVRCGIDYVAYRDGQRSLLDGLT